VPMFKVEGKEDALFRDHVRGQRAPHDVARSLGR
jgi:hypothetical protein